MKNVNGTELGNKAIKSYARLCAASTIGEVFQQPCDVDQDEVGNVVLSNINGVFAVMKPTRSGVRFTRITEHQQRFELEQHAAKASLRAGIEACLLADGFVYVPTVRVDDDGDYYKHPAHKFIVDHDEVFELAHRGCDYYGSEPLTPKAALTAYVERRLRYLAEIADRNPWALTDITDMQAYLGSSTSQAALIASVING